MSSRVIAPALNNFLLPIHIDAREVTIIRALITRFGAVALLVFYKLPYFWMLALSQQTVPLPLLSRLMTTQSFDGVGH